MQYYSLIVMLGLVALCSSNSLFVGDRQENDELIERKDLEIHGIPFAVIKKNVTFGEDHKHVITRVEAYEIHKKHNTVSCSILSGGPDDDFVTLYLESERGHGIHMVMKVYGRKIHHSCVDE